MRPVGPPGPVGDRTVDLDALANLLDPTILFFVLGLGIAAVRSNLEIPRRWCGSSRCTC